MVRNYIRKTTRQSWQESEMKSALDAVLKNEMGFKKACQTFNVPKSTLRDRYKKVVDKSITLENCAKKCSLGTIKTVFTKEQENELSEHIIQLESRLFPITIKDLRELAFQLAERNNIQNDFDKETGMAGYKWVQNFLKRNPKISLRKPEGTSGARAMGFNRVSVAKFFELLTELMDKYHFTPDRIYNVDETGISTVPKKVSKVLAKKGKPQVSSFFFS